MEDFTLPSVGARFKKWKCYRSVLRKCQAHPQTPKIKIKNPKKVGRGGGGAGDRWLPTSKKTNKVGW
jgi:hypothetical protein